MIGNDITSTVLCYMSLIVQATKDPCLVSITFNPLTNQLLALAGDGTVYSLRAPPEGEYF